MDLVFICEMDGFQHGSGPFILKQIVMLPLQGGPPATYTFATDFLLDEPQASQATFRYATRHLHGLPMALPSFDYASRADVIISYLKNRAYRYLESSGDYNDSSRPGILLLCKGEQKCKFLQDLLNTTDGVLQHLEVQDLTVYNCPNAHSMVRCRSSTGAQAAVFGAWIRERFPDSLPAILANLPVEF